MSRTKYEMAHVIDKHLADLDHIKLTSQHKKTLSALSRCRTAALGGHVDACTSCDHVRVSYNSCRNRHCPNCDYVVEKRSELTKCQVANTGTESSISRRALVSNAT